MSSKYSYDITELFKHIYEGHFRGKDRHIRNILVEFYPYTTLKNTIRRRGNTIFIRISDMLTEAPKDVMKALGIILFCKLERRKPPKSEERLYRDHVNSKEIRDRVRNLRQERGKKVLAGPKGEYYDLEESFDRVNMNYFNGGLKKPRLTWNKRKTRTRFGHHDEALNTIVISRTLDDKHLPKYLLDYVMYHEALHIRHGITYENGRRSLHTRAFKMDEKKFAERERAEALLKKLSSGSSKR